LLLSSVTYCSPKPQNPIKQNCLEFKMGISKNYLKIYLI